MSISLRRRRKHSSEVTTMRNRGTEDVTGSTKGMGRLSFLKHPMRWLRDPTVHKMMTFAILMAIAGYIQGDDDEIVVIKNGAYYYPTKFTEMIKSKVIVLNRNRKTKTCKVKVLEIHTFEKIYIVNHILWSDFKRYYRPLLSQYPYVQLDERALDEVEKYLKRTNTNSIPLTDMNKIIKDNSKRNQPKGSLLIVDGVPR